MQLRVRSITYLAEAINGYELVDPRGRDLPRFEAGAHVDLRIGGFLRQYSLWNDPAERRGHCLAGRRADENPGGPAPPPQKDPARRPRRMSLPPHHLPPRAAREP